MEQLSEQELVRRQSLQTMRDMGINPYPADEYVVTGYSTDIKATFVDEELGDEAKGWYKASPCASRGALCHAASWAKHRSSRYKTPKVVSKYM